MACTCFVCLRVQAVQVTGGTNARRGYGYRGHAYVRTPKPLFTRVESSRNGICSSRNGLGTSARGAIKTKTLCTSWFCPFTLLWLLNRMERDAVVDCCVKLAPMKETGHRIEAVSECVQRRICGAPGARPGPCTLRRGSLWAAVRGGHRDAATPEEARAAAAAKAAAGLDAAVLRNPDVIRHNKRLYDEGHHEVRGRTILCVLGVLGAIRSPLASTPVCMVAMRLQPGCERASTQADVRHGVHASLTSQPLELTSGRLPVQTVAVVRALLKAADIEMLEPLELIPDKPFTPANGDKRTYVSLATYCWPSNPDDLQNPKGPWECKDGLPFPGVRTPHQHLNMHGFVVPCTLPGRSRAARMPRRRTGDRAAGRRPHLPMQAHSTERTRSVECPRSWPPSHPGTGRVRRGCCRGTAAGPEHGSGFHPPSARAGTRLPCCRQRHAGSCCP